MTFSKTDQLFYDLNDSDITEWSASYKQAFVVFVLGRSDDVLIVPFAKWRQSYMRNITGQKAETINSTCKSSVASGFGSSRRTEAGLDGVGVSMAWSIRDEVRSQRFELLPEGHEAMRRYGCDS